MNNKNLEHYMNLCYPMEIIEDPVEGGFTISFPDLKGCLTCVETSDQIVPMANDAKRCWLEAALEEGISIPEPHYLDQYSGQFVLRIPKSLHRSLAKHAKKEGMSLNQYCSFLLATSDSRYPEFLEKSSEHKPDGSNEKPIQLKAALQ